MLASRSNIRSLRGYYAFNAPIMPVQIKAKKTSREILRKDRRKIEFGCGNSERCGRRFSCLMSLQSRCQQHHHEQDGEPIDYAKWNAGARVPVLRTSSAMSVCAGSLRNPHGRRSVSHRVPSHDDVPLNTGSTFFPPFSCPFMLLFA